MDAARRDVLGTDRRGDSRAVGVRAGVWGADAGEWMVRQCAARAAEAMDARDDRSGAQAAVRRASGGAQSMAALERDVAEGRTTSFRAARMLLDVYTRGS